jgi:hypothetical protein
MNKKLQHMVAKQYEAVGFKTLAGEIREASGVAGVRRIALKVIAKLCALDPSGFGQDIKNSNKNVNKKGVSNGKSNRKNK